VEDSIKTTVEVVEGIGTGLLVSIIPVFVLGLVVGLSVVVLKTPIQRIGGSR
jgi:hypothetical protein